MTDSEVTQDAYLPEWDGPNHPNHGTGNPLGFDDGPTSFFHATQKGERVGVGRPANDLP